MSVLIKGMEMPDSCNNCPCSYNMYWCLAVARFEDTELRSSSNAAFQRPDWCPLVEVQVPLEKRNDDYREISEKIKMMDERLRRMTEELAASSPRIIKEATTQGNK